MLRELHISGLGVIEDLDLELDPGLNVLTGETGAGKTLITVGLGLALGRRATVSHVRGGATSARVQARFDAPRAAVEAGWAEEGEIVLGRSVSREGRSAARIGGQLAPVSALAQLAADLVEVHGQHEGVRLLSTTAQTGFLDRFAGRAHLDALRALATEHELLRAAEGALAELVARERDRERELDLLRYQVREIEGADPTPGEIAELRVEEAGLAHAERLVELSTAAERSIAGDGAGADALGAAARQLRSAADLDPRAEELASRAEEIAVAAGELARDVRGYRERLELDPARLEQVRERAAALGGLLRKYGDTEEAVLAFLAEARARMEALSGADERRARLGSEVAERTDRVNALASAVSGGRAEAVPRLARAIADEIHELGMAGAVVEVTLVPTREVSSSGAERAEIVFAGGPGQAPQPLSKVASGGELSRTMLACRSVLADLDEVGTLVFDEVDAGIGGRAGLAVGRRLAQLAATRQVLVVTHLPQIAAFADRHVRVEKHGGSASVTVLDGPGRVAELTRMLAGLPGSEAAATHAEELLADAARSKAGGTGRRRAGNRQPARGPVG
ncbi:MAG TPA: DNA repair protein RecN [Actinomycetota bacterium]